ncbi:hypothetical protein ACHAXA_006802 [Cyclostephanos tholiformis]|uniref:DNA repair metallo-beta-lactamase domain-containing protein n=1 Tax=Cyclostephanos tholiformis TaxID=382380 RepID=A0ABD3RQS6_9STRA
MSSSSSSSSLSDFCPFHESDVGAMGGSDHRDGRLVIARREDDDCCVDHPQIAVSHAMLPSQPAQPPPSEARIDDRIIVPSHPSVVDSTMVAVVPAPLSAAPPPPSSSSSLCHTCGTDLSRFASLRSRIAHAKRCHAKYGMGLFGCRHRDDDEAMTTMSEEDEDDDRDGRGTTHAETMVRGGVIEASSPPPTRDEGGGCAVIVRESSMSVNDRPPHDDEDGGEWHAGGGGGGDARGNPAARPKNPSALAAKPSGGSSSLVGRFSILDPAPPPPSPAARTLTSVLMAGARRAAARANDALSLVSRNKSSSSSSLSSSSGEAMVRNSTKSSGDRQVSSRAGGNNWGNNGDRRNGRCPAYKRITGTDFICDGFHYACGTLSSNYFLTHFHFDHYGGISKNWNDGTIYCSLPTANLVIQQLGVDKKYLHPIAMNTPTIIFSRGKPVTVTLLDANHCPGAVMFLFEVGSRRILHVGDFRWDRELMMRMPQLQAFGNSSPRLDEIFLDTTYCDAKYTLPTQEEAILAAIEVVTKEMEISKKEKSMKTLFLFGSYTIGKERIYMSVAESLKSRVYVDGRRYRILSQVFTNERMRLFTTKKSETNLWVVPLGSVNFKQMNDYMEEGNKNKLFTQPYGRVVGFRPTGWTYSAEDKKQRKLPCGRPKPGRNLITSKTSGRFSVHGVPYSEHSSFPELVDCLACLKPLRITPTVSVSKSEEQLRLLLHTLRSKYT